MTLVDLFGRVLCLSIYGSIAGAGVWLIGLLIDYVRAPKGISLILWGLAALRLMLPFSAASAVSVYQIGDLNIKIEQALDFKSFIGEDAVDAIGEEGDEQSKNEIWKGRSVKEQFLWSCAVLWIAGMILLQLWGMVSYIGLKRKLRFAVKCGEDIYETDEIVSPCVAGFFPPKIYLTAELSGKQREYIILHEKMHIRYLDNIWKIFSYLAVSVHWFNPFCWLMWKKFQGELEKACDERVLRKIGMENKEDYGEALLDMARKKSWKLSVPIGFGEEDTRERIRKILRYQKPLLTVSVLMVVLGAAVYGIFFTMPGKKVFGFEGIGAESDAVDRDRVYEEYTYDGVRYQVRYEGIFRIREEGEDQIYKGYAGTSLHMTVYEGKLYFLTDKFYEEGALDWIDSTIRWIDLQSLETGDLALGIESPMIRDFQISNGTVMVMYAFPDTVESVKLSN